MTTLLEDGAAGKLNDDAVHKALGVFQRLTGGRVMVHVEPRVGRKQTNVRGVFRPRLIQAVNEYADQPAGNEPPAEEASVWLREPPRLDLIAERVHELIDIEEIGFREAAKQLQAEGHNVNSGNVWYSYQRYYDMQGESPPKQPYNNGRPRKVK